MTTDSSFLWDENVSEADFVKGYQGLIDSGVAWRLEGSVGRTAMDLIESGLCVLGRVGHRDYWGNYVPSRYEVQRGTKGSVGYARKMKADRGAR